jgi:CubicO group peptidase (beta-lactamase class C family)
MTRRLQPIIDAKAAQYNQAGLWLSVQTEEINLSLAAGLSDFASSRAAVPDQLVPVGSLTKIWTAVGVLQQVERHNLRLSDSIVDRAEPMFSRLNNGTSLVEDWCLVRRFSM